MKKTVLVIVAIVIVIISIIFAKFINYKQEKTEIDKINHDFLLYQKSIVRINTIVSLTNKAIDLNNKNNVELTNEYNYIDNNKNSIKVYMKINSLDETIEVEKLILNPKRRSYKS